MTRDVGEESDDLDHKKPERTHYKESATPSPPAMHRGRITITTRHVEAHSVGKEAGRKGSDDNTNTEESQD